MDQSKYSRKSNMAKFDEGQGTVKVKRNDFEHQNGTTFASTTLSG